MRGFREMVHAVSSVFGCTHEQLTRPFTIEQQCYMTCLNCGQKIYYSAAEMRRLSRREVRRILVAQAATITLAPQADVSKANGTGLAA